MQLCTYCGAAADSLDHVVPYSWNHVKKRKGNAGSQGSGEKVWSCRECNSLLGDKPLFTVEQRRDYIRKALSKRASKTAVWSDEELDELGPSLRSAVEFGQTKSSRAQARINNASRACLEAT